MSVLHVRATGTYQLVALRSSGRRFILRRVWAKKQSSHMLN